MENLCINQVELTDAIEKFIKNLQKAGLERRTADYFQRRLDILENYWAEYRNNHDSICALGVTEHPYFKNSEYEHTKALYLSAKERIKQQREEVTGASTSTSEPPVEKARTGAVRSEDVSSDSAVQAPRPLMVSRGATSKSDDLLRKQFVNFKAFMRTVNTINLAEINEKWEFEDILKELQCRWSTIDSLHWSIHMELNGEDEEYEAIFTKHESKYIALKKAVNQKLWSSSHREKMVPNIEIPTFSGNYQQWTSFKDLFKETIHDNPSLSLAQKMQFLKGRLRSEPERLIQHLHVSSENYSACWDILNNRYNNKKLIFTAHLNTLLALPTINQQQSLPQIKKMHDVTLETLHAVENLGVEVTSWDPFLVHILSQKLDSETYNDYMDSLTNPRDLPILKEFLSYLESKFTRLESAKRKQDQVIPKSSTQHHSKQQTSGKKPYNSNNQNNPNKSFNITAIKCPLCGEDHSLFHCSNFNSLSSEIKLKKAKELKTCINCLFNHNGKQCISTKRCRKCNGKHNTLIHDAIVKAKPTHSNNVPTPAASESVGNNLHVSKAGTGKILLATALIKIISEEGTCHIMRALIDQGSQISLISESAAQRLGAKRNFCRGVIYGIGEKATNSKGMISVTCMSIYNDFKFSTDVLIMNNLIKKLPQTTFTKPSWQFIQNIDLADPEFYVSRPIDLLLGSDIYAMIKMGGISRAEEPSLPLAEQTQLGWILFGKMQSYHCNVILNNIEDIQRFWEVEDIEVNSEVSSEEQKCIDLFSSTTKRRPDGRYEVKLPMKQEVHDKLGLSKSKAIGQFRSLENKFEKQPNLAAQYKKFMSEYSILQHMIPSNYTHKSNDTSSVPCFLPHHSVQREESSTTKLRVVFNASAKTSSGFSVNDMMYKGPKLQKDLQSLILKWRTYKYAFTSDIEKMYRQIMVNEEDQVFQHIVWRESKYQPIQSYQLTTVAFGVKASPFLAMMTLKKLAADERQRYPQAAQVVEEAMFVDDVIHGVHDLDSGKQLIADLNSIMKSGGFTLRKWISNEPQLLEAISEEGSQGKPIFNFKSEGTSKTLGLRWDSQRDTFIFRYDIVKQTSSTNTKRIILSEISKLFDPLGWLGPLTTSLKLLFQKVWTANLQWDDVLPENINLEWIKIRSDIYHLNECEVPRWIGYHQGDVIQLHGFCDASLKAYASVIYARIVTKDQVKVILLTSKSRLVPCSKTITLPRLEICGAELLAKLMSKVIQSLPQVEIQIYGWTDSMVVLGWLQGDPNRWKTFVSNRVKTIAKTIPPNCWRYVKSGENPADAASRGLLASQLAGSSLWWQGPKWLKSFMGDENQTKYTTKEEEINGKQVNCIQKNSDDSIILELLLKYSSLAKTIRILAWILRAFDKTTSECKQRSAYLTLRELKQAKQLIIKYVQRCEFQDDIEHYRKHKMVKNTSKLLNLNPFLDSNGILRVGGRLKNAQIHSDMKYPIILPHGGIFTTRLIEQAHLLTYHGGPRLTLSNLRQQYWIISGNRAVKKEVRKCVKCRKHDPKLQCQLMGNLPAARVNPAPPFYYTGVDYTGFVEIKAHKGRGIKTSKGYVALFICMVTKAIHLELVSDLSSTAFLAALRRMAARRGAPRHMFSDNGSNFVGANRNLNQEFHNLKSTLDEAFFKEITDLKIEWHFNAPSFPSGGGYWERGIRSIKYHLKRIVGDQKLTFEEFSTLLSQLEACINSRPLCPLSEDVEDLDFLTPSHFLAGRAGNTIIETAQDARTRWHLAHKLAQDIWKRFKVEYLTQLSVRSKWFKKQENLKIGDMVTIHDDNLPAGKWMMGRVVEVHKGSDGLVRIVSLKTRNGVIQRPIVKLSILPIPPSSLTVVPDEQDTANQANQSITSSKTRLKPNKGFLAMCLSLFLLITTLTSSSYATYNITQLNKHQGLFFDKISNMKLIRDQWKLVVYYNMDPYWNGIIALEKYQKYLEQTCARVSSLSQCDVILLQLRHSYQELQFTNQVLLGQHNDTRSRTRRGLINGVGYLANTLFGVLDDHFAEQYQKDITMLRENQRYLATLWKNQTSVVEGEYNVLQRIEESINKQHKVIDGRLNELVNATLIINEHLKTVEVLNDFTISAMITQTLISSIRGIQDKLVEMLTDVHHQQFNTHILSPQQMLEELNIIAGQLTKDLSLPIEHIHLEIATIYQLLKVRARLTSHYFIFEINIPLVTRDSYELYLIIPIPLRQANSTISIVPLSDYVAINMKKDTYIPLNENEVQRCVHTSSFTYLCYVHTLIYNLKSDNNLCHPDASLRNCQTITATCNNKWIQLSNINTYLFYCCTQCTLRFMCGDQVNVEQVQGAHIIKFEPNCIIRGEHLTVYAQNTKLSNTLSFDADVYSPQIAQINHVINISLTPRKNGTADLDLVELTKLGEKVKDLRAANVTEDHYEFYHHVHHYAISYTLVTLAIAAVAVFLWRRSRRAGRRGLTAPPSPPSSISVISMRKLGRAVEQPVSVQVQKVCNKKDQACSPLARRSDNTCVS